MIKAIPGAPAPGGRSYGLPPIGRMGIALLSLVGLFVASYLLLFKLGVIGSLACTGGGCHTVQISPWAVFLGVPVPAWGVAGYALLLAASLLGLQPRFAGDGRVGFTLVALASLAFGFSLYLTALEAFVIDAWCRWCVGSAAVSTLIFGFSLAEVPWIVRPRRR